MSIAVRFVCGHTGSIPASAITAPVCACGETKIARTIAPPPRFRGACSGPYAETRQVDPAIVDLGARPLTLKQESSDGR